MSAVLVMLTAALFVVGLLGHSSRLTGRTGRLLGCEQAGHAPASRVPAEEQAAVLRSTTTGVVDSGP